MCIPGADSPGYWEQRLDADSKSKREEHMKIAVLGTAMVGNAIAAKLVNIVIKSW
jgi:hypothetical protein